MVSGAGKTEAIAGGISLSGTGGVFCISPDPQIFGLALNNSGPLAQSNRNECDTNVREQGYGLSSC